MHHCHMVISVTFWWFHLYFFLIILLLNNTTGMKHVGYKI